MVRRLVPPALSLALGAAVALGLTACGGGEDAQLLPGSTAQQINENLGRVKQLAEEGECVGAADAAQEVSNQIESLGGVDAKLKQALEQGSARLEEAVTGCEETATEAAPPTELTEEVPSDASHRAEKEEEKREKEAEKLEKDEEKEAEKEEKEAEHEAGPPEEATPPGPPTTPPGQSGGTGGPGGVGPNSPAGGGD